MKLKILNNLDLVSKTIQVQICLQSVQGVKLMLHVPDQSVARWRKLM